MMASTAGRGRSSLGRDEEEPMDVDPSLEEALKNFYTWPGVPEAPSVLYSFGEVAKGEGTSSRL